MTQKTYPIQTKMQNVLSTHPIEIFRWGRSPDHFILENPHAHTFDELLFFTQGGGVHEINKKKHTIKQYSIHFIPERSIHFMDRSGESDGLTLAFDSAHLERNEIHSFNNPLNFLGYSMHSFVLNLDEARFMEIFSIFNYLEQQIAKTPGYFKEKCFLLTLELILNSIASEARKGSQAIERKKIKNPLAGEFIGLVEKHLLETTSVGCYAKKLYVSPNYLSNIVKLELGLSPKQYITSSLLVSVKRHLYDTKESLKMIAFKHNMDLASLGKLFKKNIGYTMTDYRLQKK